jgi:magnesium transporter
VAATVPLADPPSKHWPASLFRRGDGALEQNLSAPELRRIVERGEGTLWVDIDSSDVHQHALLEKVFQFHPLAIEDTLSPGTRVKLEEYDRYLFVVVSGIRFDRATSDPYDLETFNLYFFLGKSFLVTVHAIESSSCDSTRDRLMRNPDLLGRGAEMTMHAIIDQAVDAYFPMVEQLNEHVDTLEQRLFDAFDEGLIHEIFKAKRSAYALRRHIGPLREVLNVLSNRPSPYLRPETQLYYRDVYDHTIRIMESVDTTRDLLGGVLETYLSQTSNRMNRVMKQLSIVATLALPLIVVGGIYGMNFSQMPLTHHPFGFYWALGSMFAVAAVMLVWLRSKKWL